MRFLSSLLLFVTISIYGHSQDLDYIEFPKADSIAELYPRHSLHDLQGLSRKLTAGLSAEEAKFRAIYKWVCLNIANDGKIAQANKRNREKLAGEELAVWNTKLIPQVNKKLMEQYVTICTGYAWLIQQLSKYARLECAIVHGYGRTIQSNIGGKGLLNHSWNAIRLNGKWYLCDATWSSGALDAQSSSFIRKYEDAYFLPDPSYFIHNHYPLDNKWTLLDQYPTLDEFLNGPLIYVAAYSHKIQPLYPNNFNVAVSRDSTLTFRLACKEEIRVNSVKLQLRSLKISNTPVIRDGIISFTYRFRRRGTFAMHIVIDDRPVYSYSVCVK